MIEVGDFVRTDTGKIDKVINNNYYMPQYIVCEKGIVDKENIVKHSKNIIDLIEVGDYVNGRLVLQTDCKTQNVCLLIPFTDTKANTNIMWYGYEDIETILTKEQYMQNCYTVERKKECGR